MADEKIILVNRGSQHAATLGKFWKELLPEGIYVHPSPIQDVDLAKQMLGAGQAMVDAEGDVHQVVPAPREFLDQCVSTFAEAKKLGIKVHFADGHNNVASKNLGWWEDMKVLLPEDVRKLGVEPRHDRPALWGVVDVPDPDNAKKMGNEIQDVSVKIVPAGDPELCKSNPDKTLIKLPAGIAHVAATPKPVITDQAPFVPIAASAEPHFAATFEIDLSKPVKPTTPTATALTDEQVTLALGMDFARLRKDSAAARKHLKDTKFDVASLGVVAEKLADRQIQNLYDAFTSACGEYVYDYHQTESLTKSERLAEVKKAAREFLRLLDEIRIEEGDAAMSVVATTNPPTPTGAPAELAMTPKTDETHDAYMKRCMADDAGKKGACQAAWDKMHKKESAMDATANLSLADVEAKLGFTAGTFTAPELSVAVLDKHPRFVELSAALAAEKQKTKTAEAALTAEKGAQRINQIKTRIETAQKTGRLNKAMADKRLAEVPELSVADWSDRAAKLEAKLDMVDELPENSVVPFDAIAGPPSGPTLNDASTPAEDDRMLKSAGLGHAIPKPQKKEQ